MIQKLEILKTWATVIVIAIRGINIFIFYLMVTIRHTFDSYVIKNIFIYSSYLSSSSRKDSNFSQEKLNNMPLKNEDYCILTYFEDFTSLYVGKAIKSDKDGSYNFFDFDTLCKTACSTG